MNRGDKKRMKGQVERMREEGRKDSRVKTEENGFVDRSRSALVDCDG